MKQTAGQPNFPIFRLKITCYFKLNYFDLYIIDILNNLFIKGIFYLFKTIEDAGVIKKYA